MVVPFQEIPSNIQVPGVRIEVGAKRSVNASAQIGPRVIIAPKTSAGTATADVPVRVDSESQAASLFGSGSIAHRMVVAYRANDPTGELWVIPVADHGSGVPATMELAVSGTATEAGTLFLTVGGIDVSVPVASGATASTVKASIVSAITAMFPATAVSDTNGVDFTAKNDGTLGNELRIAINRLGSAAGQKTPAGLTVTTAAFTSGATDPSLTAAIAALGEDLYDQIILPWAGTTELNAIAANVATRWGYTQMLYGHVLSAKRETVANLETFGAARNDEEVTVLGYDDSLSPPWDWAAAYGGAVARAYLADPGRQLRGLPLYGIIAPPRGGAGRFTFTQRQAMLVNGVATYNVVNDLVVLERARTTYKTDTFGNADVTWRDTEVRHLVMRILREQRANLAASFEEARLADDGQIFDSGLVIATPSAVQSKILEVYMAQGRRGWVENSPEKLAAFLAALKVERPEANADQIDILFPPNIINWVRNIHMRAEPEV